MLKNRRSFRMKFDTYFPSLPLRPYIKHFVVSENELESEYKVLPSSGLVMGVQYRGELSSVNGNHRHKLAKAGITGISDSYRIFNSSASVGTILVYFTEIGFTHFSSHPANELFNLSLSLDDIFDKNKVSELEERIASVNNDKQRVKLVEQFFISQFRDMGTDKLIVEAVKLIYESRGNVRIKELNEKLLISQSPFEKRFRKVVGTTPKKFASIVRFNSILSRLDQSKSLTEICYENGFFDQAHFIKDFKQFTGNTPEQFKRGL